MIPITTTLSSSQPIQNLLNSSADKMSKLEELEISSFPTTEIKNSAIASNQSNYQSSTLAGTTFIQIQSSILCLTPLSLPLKSINFAVRVRVVRPSVLSGKSKHNYQACKPQKYFYCRPNNLLVYNDKIFIFVNCISLNKSKTCFVFLSKSTNMYSDILQ